MKFLSFLLALALSVAVTGNSMANPPSPVPQKEGMMGTKDACPMDSSLGGKGGCVLGSFIGTAVKNQKELGLTDDQIKKLTQFKLECQKIKTLDGAQVTVACMELKAMMGPANFDLEAVKAQIKKKMDLLASMKIKEMELYQKAISVLTSEQLKQVAALIPLDSTSGDCPETGAPMGGDHMHKGPGGMQDGSMPMYPKQ